MSNPTVSVIIPVYKAEPYLHDCLESVLAQSFQDFEIICVNDGSPDKCGEILEQYAQKDNRFTIVTQSNQGISIARNQAMKLATGTYILFLDSDDFIHHQLLEMTVTLAQKNNADMVSFNFVKNKGPEALDYTLSSLNEIPICVTNDALKHMKKKANFRFPWNAWSKLYRSELVKDTPFIAGICFEDYPHTLAVLKKNPKVVLTQEKMYYYCPNNTTSVSRGSFSVKKVNDYRIGLNAVIDAYMDDDKQLTFIVRNLFPRILKAQYELIRKSPENKPALWAAFAEELADVQARGCLTWHGQLRRWFSYKRLLSQRKL